MTPIATARIRPGPPNEIYDAARHRAAPDCYVVGADLTVVSTTATAAPGESVILPEPVARFVAGLIEAAGGGLSVRETDVLNCLARGERTKGMAKTLGISEATVSDHVKSIMAKMNCHSRTQLLARVFGPS